MTKELTRKELYDLVWSKPVEKIASEYGLSGRGLSKLCKRNSIPVPPRGYWAKLTAGKKVVKQPSLIMMPDMNETYVVLRPPRPGSSPKSGQRLKEEYPPEIQEAIDRERLPEHKITIPKRISRHHRIVTAWLNKEAKERQDLRRHTVANEIDPTR